MRRKDDFPRDIAVAIMAAVLIHDLYFPCEGERYNIFDSGRKNPLQTRAIRTWTFDG
jgi:hypothetical protein